MTLISFIQARLKVGDIVKCCINRFIHFGIFVEVSNIRYIALLSSIFFSFGNMKIISCTYPLSIWNPKIDLLLWEKQYWNIDKFLKKLKTSY